MYLVAVASLLAAILSFQLGSDTTREAQVSVLIGFAVVFFVISVFGFLTIFQLVRLRLAWRESARAMNAIKHHVVLNSDRANDVFLWTQATMPPAFKPTSVSFISALQVAIISGVMFGSCIIELSG